MASFSIFSIQLESINFPVFLVKSVQEILIVEYLSESIAFIND